MKCKLLWCALYIDLKWVFRERENINLNVFVVVVVVVVVVVGVLFVRGGLCMCFLLLLLLFFGGVRPWAYVNSGGEHSQVTFNQYKASHVQHLSRQNK